MTVIHRTQRGVLLVRVFAVACALATLPFAPLYFATLDRIRVQPLNVADGQPQVDGSVVVGTIRVEAMRISAEPWTPAASPTYGRRLRNLPVGTGLAYKVRDSSRTRVVSGAVTERESTNGLLGRAAKGALTAAFAIAGMSLALATRSRTATLGAGFLSGAGLALGFAMLEPNVVRISSWPLRNLLIVGVVAVPSGLWAWFLPRLLYSFPKPLSTGRLTRAVIASVGIIALARALLMTWAQIPIAFDWLPWRIQFLILRIFSSLLLKTAPSFVASIVAAAMVIRQMQSRDRANPDATRRGDIVAIAFTVGCGLPIAAILVQGLSLLVAGKVLIARDNMPMLFLPLLIVPAALMYALLSRHVDSLGVLARRAMLFAIAGNSIRALMIVPLALLAVLLYRHREESVRAMLASHPLVWLLAVGGALAGLRYSDRIHDLVERVFFRERQDARRILRELAEATKRASGSGELVEMITQEIDKALHLESVALFLRNPKTQKLVPPPRTNFPPLDLASTVVLVAQREDEPLDIDLADRRSPLRNVTEMERQWLDQGDFRLRFHSSHRTERCSHSSHSAKK